jgi:HSP20 family protein
MLTRIYPADPFRTMELFFDAMRPNARPTNRAIRKPGLAQLREEEQSFVLTAELPGVALEHIELSADDEWVELKATRNLAAPEGFKPLRRERSEYELHRRFALPKRIDNQRIEATLRDGVLTVTLPKHASASPRTIEVKAA